MKAYLAVSHLLLDGGELSTQSLHGLLRLFKLVLLFHVLAFNLFCKSFSMERGPSNGDRTAKRPLTKLKFRRRDLLLLRLHNSRMLLLVRALLLDARLYVQISTRTLNNLPGPNGKQAGDKNTNLELIDLAFLVIVELGHIFLEFLRLRLCLFLLLLGGFDS